MKKTIFINSYQISTMIFKVSFFLMSFSVTSKLLAVIFETSSFPTLHHFSKYINLANDVSILILLVLAISLYSIFLHLIFLSYKNDQVQNLMRSIDETWELHHFLKRCESTSIAAATIQQTNKSNKVTREFNRSAKRSIVDIQNDSVTIYIQIPRSQQAQEILQKMNSQLKEQLSSRMPDYYFSNGTRKKNTLWIKGKKR